MARVRNVVNGRRRFLPGMTNNVTAMGVAWGAVDGVTTAYFDQAENPEHAPAYSALKGLAVGAGWVFAEPLMLGIEAGKLAKSGIEMAYEEAKSNSRQAENLRTRASQLNVNHQGEASYGGTLGGYLEDNQQTATMRQRQMELMRQHRVGMETILGSEARQLHR